MLSKQIPASTMILGTLVAIFVAVLAVTSLAHAERTSVSSGSGIMVTTPCAAGTSSLAFIQSPFVGATSTVTFFKITGTNGATSTDILVGTSTVSALATGAATSSLSENVLGMFNVPTSTQFLSVAGSTIGPSAGYNSASGGTYRTNAYTTIAPNEGLLVFATSTFGGTRNGGTGASQVAIPASCTIESIWYQ